MPVIAINLTADVFERIRGYVDRQMYASVEQFVEIAACNQLALEDGITPQELIENNHRAAPSPKRKGDSRRSLGPASEPRKVERSRQADSGDIRNFAERVSQVWAPFSIESIRTSQLKPLPTTVRSDSERIWGQVNRLLPFKIACRWLATHAPANGNWPSLSTIGDQIADDAAAIGSALLEVDAHTRRVRDDQLATSLPKVGNIASKDRFLSHFVARTIRSGYVYPGAIIQYALADLDESRIGLTSAGAEFAALQNPVLDGSPEQASSSLSPAEQVFLQNQIIHYVPGEYRDCELVISAIVDGHDTPTALGEAVFDSMTSETSVAAKQTHLSGIIARLTELGAVKRTWSGRRVTYEVKKLEGLPLFDHLAQTAGRQ